MALKSNALVSVSEYKLYSGLDTDDENLHTDTIETFINIASQAIETYCARSFRSGSDTYVLSGDGSSSVYTRYKPITSITSIEYWNVNAWVEATIDLYPYTYISESGKVYFTEGNVFSFGSNNFRIIYSYGYSLSEIPQDLKSACMIMAQRSYKRAQGKEGLKSESFGDATTSYDFSTIPVDVLPILDRYRRRFIA